MNLTTYTYSQNLLNDSSKIPAPQAKDSVVKKPLLSSKNLISYTGSIQYTTTYIDGDDILFGLDGFYNEVNIVNTLDIDNVPISLDVIGVNNTGTVNNSFYTYSIHYSSTDLARALEQVIINKLKEKARKRYDSLYAKTLGPIEGDVKRFDADKAELNDPAIIAKRQKNQSSIDSLEKLKSSGQLIDSLQLDSLKREQAKYQALEKEFYSLLDTKAKAVNYQRQLDNAMRPFNSCFKPGNEISDSSLLHDLPKSNTLSGWQKDMLAVKDISIGESTLDFSPFTIDGILFKGLSVKVNPEDLYAAVSIGTEMNTTPIIDPYYYYTLPFNRKIDYIQIGMGDPVKSHLYFSYTDINDGSQSSNPSVTAFPEHNTIYDIEDEEYLSKSVYIKTEIAHSKLTFGAINETFNVIDSAANTFTTNSAISTEVNAAVPQTNSSFNLHFSNVGKQFITLGDIYLVPGAINYGGYVTQNFLKSKLKIKIGLDQVNTNLGTSSSVQNMSRSSLDLGGSYDLGKYGSIQVQYLPNNIISNPTVSTTGISNQQNMFTMTGNTTFLMGKVRYTTSVNVNNYYYALSSLGENLTRLTNYLIYYNFNENIMLPGGNFFSILASWSNNNWFDGQVQQYIAQGSYTFTVNKKINLTFGGNESRQVYNPVAIGCLSAIQLAVFKVTHLSLSVNYKNYINTFSKSNGQVYALSSLFINW